MTAASNNVPPADNSKFNIETSTPPQVTPYVNTTSQGKPDVGTTGREQQPVTLQPVLFKGVDVMRIVGTILQCVIEISKKHFFGTEVVLNVLRGSACEKVKKYKLDESHTYGQLANIGREDLRTVIDWLIQNKFLYKRDGRYPVIHITYSGNHYKEILTDRLLKNLVKMITGQA